MSQILLEMAKDLVFAQIHAQGLSPEDMHTSLQETFNSLLALHAREASYGLGAVETPERPAPSNWKKSITKHDVKCLICGASFRQLSAAHLRTHGLDARSYRMRFGIPRRYPLAARSLTARHKQLAQQLRPWEKAPMYRRKQEQTQQFVTKKTRQQKAPASETSSIAGRGCFRGVGLLFSRGV